MKDYWRDRVMPKLEMIEGLARNGCSNGQIADNLGISQKTFYEMVKNHDEFHDAVLEGREYAEVRVENALFKRAIGFKYKEVTRERRKVYDEDGDWTGDWELVVTKAVLKHQVPDVGAATYWLEHRAPKRWERTPAAGLDLAEINQNIQSLADILRQPVPERQIGSEDE